MGIANQNRGQGRAASAGWWLALALVVTLMVGCTRRSDPGTSLVAAGIPAEEISWTAEAASASAAVTPELLAEGERIYRENCSACHGQAGDGGGVCAPFMAPQPRDFTSGIFRFKSTPDGRVPTDQDLFKTVSAGLHGTGMPPWKFLLEESDRWAVVHYIKGFSERFADADPSSSIDLGEPPPATPERVASGKELYLATGCGACHGNLGYGDGPAAATLVDDFGKPVLPRNFHKIGQFKRGFTVRDVALTIHTGNNGTPMPSFRDALAEDQIWDIAIYILSLAERRLSGGGSPAAASMGDELGEPDVVIELMERNWKYVPDVIRVKQGQIVRIEFQPTDNGVGAGHGFAVDGYDRVAFINGAMVQRPKTVTFRADKPGTYTFYCSSQCSTGPLHPNMKGTLVVEPAAG